MHYKKILPLLSFIFPAHLFAQDSFPPLGKLVDIGGWKLHLYETGTDHKGPTIILESGSGDFSFDWWLVQKEVASFARVCSYDRAGLAWSGLGPKPRTFTQVAYELHTALKKAHIPSPYILVGQSIGGIFIRIFESMYPDEVAGMILVDATHEDTRLFMNGKLMNVRELSQGRTIPAVRTAISASDTVLTEEDKNNIKFSMEQFPATISAPFDKLPDSIQQRRLWALKQTKYFVAENDPYWGEEFSDIYDKRLTQKFELGNKPLIILIAASKGDGGGPSDSTERKAWLSVQQEKLQQKQSLADMSHNSKVIIDPQSGHHIQLDDPALVIRSVKEVLDAIRTNSKLQ